MTMSFTPLGESKREAKSEVKSHFNVDLAGKLYSDANHHEKFLYDYLLQFLRLFGCGEIQGFQGSSISARAIVLNRRPAEVTNREIINPHLQFYKFRFKCSPESLEAIQQELPFKICAEGTHYVMFFSAIEFTRMMLAKFKKIHAEAEVVYDFSDEKKYSVMNRTDITEVVKTYNAAGVSIDHRNLSVHNFETFISATTALGSFAEQRKTALMMGLHPKAGKNSSVQAFHSKDLGEMKLLGLILNHLPATNNLEYEPHTAESLSKHALPVDKINDEKNLKRLKAQLHKVTTEQQSCLCFFSRRKNVKRDYLARVIALYESQKSEVPLAICIKTMNFYLDSGRMLYSYNDVIEGRFRHETRDLIEEILGTKKVKPLVNKKESQTPR